MRRRFFWEIILGNKNLKIENNWRIQCKLRKFCEKMSFSEDKTNTSYLSSRRTNINSESIRQRIYEAATRIRYCWDERVLMIVQVQTSWESGHMPSGFWWQ